jgi:hypothetical protein
MTRSEHHISGGAWPSRSSVSPPASQRHSTTSTLATHVLIAGPKTSFQSPLASKGQASYSIIFGSILLSDNLIIASSNRIRSSGARTHRLPLFAVSRQRITRHIVAYRC